MGVSNHDAAHDPDGLVGEPALRHARQLFESAGLSFPTVPTPLHSAFARRSEWRYSTRVCETSPYDLLRFAAEVTTGDAEDLALLAHDGHGSNSWALHHYVVFGPIALFVQRSWGGAYGDPDTDSLAVSAALSRADAALSTAPNIQGIRAIIIDSDHVGQLWSPIGGPIDQDDFAAIDWIRSDDIWGEAGEHVRQLAPDA